MDIQPFESTLQFVLENNNKAFRQMFRDQIKGNFLIEIKMQIIRRLGTDFMKCYDFQWNFQDILTGKNNPPEYDICRFIIGIHHAHSIFLAKDKIRENEKNTQYKEQLIHEIIDKIRLRQYGSFFFRKNPIFPGKSFLYYPVPYDIFVLCMRAHHIYSKADDNPTYLWLIFGIIHNGLAVLSLMEDNFLGNAYPLCRSIIEMYFKLLILKDVPNACNSYEDFKAFELEQSCCSRKYPPEFYNKFKNRTYQEDNNKINYLHFGWVDYIEGYHNYVKESPYSLKGIITFLKEQPCLEQHKKIDILELFYKSCHAYTHGSTQIAKYPELHYFEISIMLYYTIRDTFLLFCNDQNVDPTIDGIDLISILDKDFDELYQQYQKYSTENFEAEQNKTAQ